VQFGFNFLLNFKIIRMPWRPSIRKRRSHKIAKNWTPPPLSAKRPHWTTPSPDCGLLLWTTPWHDCSQIL